MKFTMRRYQKDEDYWRIREFLRKVFLLNNRQEISWEVARFDYWRWHGILNMKDGTLEDDVFLWENTDGEIVAVLNREAPGSTFLQIHPQYHSYELEEEMLTVAEQHLIVPSNNNRHSLHVWVEKGDMHRQEMLKNRGYSICSKRKPECQRKRILTEPIQSTPIASGFTIRSMGDIDEHPTRCRASWRAFHPNEPDDRFETGWYYNVQRAPLYHRDLDMVAIAPNGDMAAFCTIWFDDVTRTGYFEPVGTVPEYRHQGIGKSILTEGLIRLKHIGADIAYVSSYTEPAHALYESVGFKEYRILEVWTKEI